MDIFTRVIGHEDIRRHLAGAIEDGTLSHAYLFEGPSGVGKKTMAVECVRALLCTKPQAHHMACGQCLSCRTIDTHNHPDVKYITRGEKSSIGIGVLREQLISDIHIQPYQSARKVYIIEDADTMTPEAQNALLKTLEEPPAYVLILLLANNSRGFLPTILSRIITLHFQPLKEEEIAGELTRRLGLPLDRAAVMAALSRGSLGTALNLVSSESFQSIREEITAFMESLHQKKPSEIIGFAEFFTKNQADQEMIFSLMLIFLRDLLMIKEGMADDQILTKDKIDNLRHLAIQYTADEILERIHAVENIQDAIRRGAQYAFAIDCLMASFI